MGQDKALMSLHPGGQPLLALVIDRLRPLTDDLFLVGDRRPAYEQFGARLVPDLKPGHGPLGGIAGALRHAHYDRCLIVACDMPFLNPGLLTYMASAMPDTADVLVPLLPRDLDTPGSPLVHQTLHAIYRRSCLTSITRRLENGQLRIMDLYSELKVQTIGPEQMLPFDPKLRSCVSLNTPAALAQARVWLADSPG